MGTAQNKQNAGVMGDIFGGVETAGGLLGEYFAPGNPNSQLIGSGVGTLIGNNVQGGQGQGGGFTSALSSLPGFAVVGRKQVVRH